jgi:hypothetical protein
MRRSTPGAVERLHTFVREYTDGLKPRDVRRLFDRDAARAYDVLTREHSREGEPAKGLKRFFFRAKLAFLGLSYKLTPPRRLLFAGSLLAFALGLVGTANFSFSHHQTRINVEFSPFWFAVSVGGLIFLLALELVDRVRVRDELEVARELQSELLPHDLPAVPGYGFAHSYRTANEVGGDYYDVMALPDGRLALVVGDASGHGMASGLVMAIANAILKTALDLDPATGEMEYASAGHPYPLLRRAGGRIEELGNGGFPLGIRDPLPLVTRHVTLEPGDLLVLYTDGLPEAVDSLGKTAFGYERIRAALEIGGTPQEVHDLILRAFDRHVGDEPLRDDLTLEVIARLRLFSAAPSAASA